MKQTKIVFVGSKALGKSILETLYSVVPAALAGVITVDDSKDERCALESFKEFADRTNVSLRILQKPSELKSAIIELQPDICLVTGWYWILKPDLLSMVPLGWLGIHASLLPKYRGSAPLVWAILNGESLTGVSLFYFDEGMDTGDIAAQRKINIEPEDNISDLLAKVEQEAIDMVRVNFPLILEGQALRVKQDHEQATYVAVRRPSDGKIDWHQSAITIHNFIRAQSHPYPGAFGYLDGKVIRIWNAKPFDRPFYGTPGQVALLEKDHVIVTCGNGTALRLYSVQPEEMDEQDAILALKFDQRLK